MNAAFFALAFGAAVNPKLLAVDLLLAKNRRARAMFLCVILGAMGVGIAIGLIDVLVVRADAIQAQGQPSAGVDIALGVLLLAAATVIMTGRLPRLHRSRKPASKPPGGGEASGKNG